jgi:hypothetical protein
MDWKFPIFGWGKVESYESIHHPTELEKKNGRKVQMRIDLNGSAPATSNRIWVGGGKNDFELLDSHRTIILVIYFLLTK